MVCSIPRRGISGDLLEFATMYDRTKFLIVAVATGVRAGCASAPPGPVATPADTVYHGGPIVTVDDAKPSATSRTIARARSPSASSPTW